MGVLSFDPIAMKIGASYYPEILPKADWERDLGVGRDLGLSVLRCGEFAWSAFAQDQDSWTPEWALEFLDVAARLGYDVIWCTPSATPPPYLFDEWPDLHGVNIDGHTVPVGLRRHYCPSHSGYRARCIEIGGRIFQSLMEHTAIKGWQIDNELAGDGFTCWCDRCQAAFQRWLRERYGSLQALNKAWQTGVWSQVYTRWEQIPIPAKIFPSHAPAIRLDYRRFRSHNWLAFYNGQADALRKLGARSVTTNFFNLTWDMPFDHWQWRPHLDAIGVSHYMEEETASRFQLAELVGPQPGDKPLWVLEQKAGQQAAQNLFPEDLSRIERHLRTCKEAGAEYAIYWHLRQHSAGCEMEHGAVLRHDGRATRIAEAIRDAIQKVEAVEVKVAPANALLVFSFQQQWANESHPQPGTPFDYREEIEQHWFGAACDAFGAIRIGAADHVTPQHKLVLVPHFAMLEPGCQDRLHACAMAGGTVVVTANFGARDFQNNVLREPPLGCFSTWTDLPAFEMFHLKDSYRVPGTLHDLQVAGRQFWALPLRNCGDAAIGCLEADGRAGPLALRLGIGLGKIIILLTSLDRTGLAELLRRL